jgi:hypothetical protein
MFWGQTSSLSLWPPLLTTTPKPGQASPTGVVDEPIVRVGTPPDAEPMPDPGSPGGPQPEPCPCGDDQKPPILFVRDDAVIDASNSLRVC